MEILFPTPFITIASVICDVKSGRNFGLKSGGTNPGGEEH